MKKILFILLGLMAIGFWSCGPEEEPCCGPEQIEVAEMTVTINHLFGTQEIEFNKQYTLPSKEIVEFSRYDYILSDFQLTKKDNSVVELTDQYALIKASQGQNSFTLTDVPMGEYKSFQFSVGLDSLTNHGNPNIYTTDHPLSPINNSLHWTWTNGYIFTAIEGRTMANNESFSFHLAGFKNKTAFEFPISVTKNEPALNALLEYDIEEVFIYPQLYTISIDGATAHSVESPVTTKLFGNMVDVFTLNSISE